MHFRRTRASLSAAQRERLEHVLEARERAEGDATSYMRYVGIFAIAMAALALAPSIPFIVPYSLTCLATATAILAAYLHFRRATERRVAPLVPRNPWRSLPPVAIAATAICLLGAASFAVYPQFRLGAIIVVVSVLAVVGVAWRIAVAPALLFGDDPQVEYVVDEHLRLARAMSLVGLACAPPTVFVSLAGATFPAGAIFVDAIQLTVVIAFLVAMLFSFMPMRKRISIA